MQLIVAANQFLRVYALYGRDRRIAIGVPFAAGTGVIVDVWAITVQKASDAAEGCHPMISSATANRLAIVWEALFAYDLLIFVLTVAKAARDRAQLALAERGGLVSIIYRDGAMYFAVIVCAQCANVITFYAFPPVLKGVLSTLASSISVTMMSRGILNLHERQAQLRGVTAWGLDDTLVGRGPAPVAPGFFAEEPQAGPSSCKV
ncbi:hypothetical protein PsYK624_040730 [Phanerochaete sordida]|uniref:Uncharacterized protein n=1 Tax=Phanerochaete sordida TaxID=48140 RepID=A0A9P3G5L8_9APHY|nr:hypothetical protein PsYK624_040730 [Phanerochaete sordida]